MLLALLLRTDLTSSTAEFVIGNGGYWMLEIFPGHT